MAWKIIGDKLTTDARSKFTVKINVFNKIIKYVFFYNIFFAPSSLKSFETFPSTFCFVWNSGWDARICRSFSSGTSDGQSDDRVQPYVELQNFNIWRIALLYRQKCFSSKVNLLDTKQVQNTWYAGNSNITWHTLFDSIGAKDQLMVAAYIQSGVLKFKVNCGTQVILFTDPRNRVDTG